MIATFKSFVDGLYGRPYLLLVLTTFMWACNAIAGQLARGEITPMQHVLIRWIMVTALMWPLYGRQAVDYLPMVRQYLWSIAAMSVTGFTMFNILFYVASFNTTAVNVGILQGSVPVIVVLLAFLFRGTSITALQGVGVVITLVGVALVATRGAPWLVLGIAFNIGDIAMLLACASYSAYAVLLQGRPPMPGSVFFTLMAPIAGLTAIPPVIWETVTQQVTWPTATGWLITAFVALFPGTIAQLFFMRGVDLIGPGRAGAFTNLVPVFAAGLAIVILGEVFAWYHGAALALVLGGILLVQRAARS
jgi:drug/metabolite transporter (DMT)-like permease